MSNDKLLFMLAKDFVMYKDTLDNERSSELELEEAKEGVDRIYQLLIRDYYDIDKFNYYQKLYKAMSVEDYYKFIKTFE